MVDGGWCFLVSVFIFIFSDEIQTKWNLTIIVFDLFKEKWNFWNPVAKFDIDPHSLPVGGALL